MNTMLACPAPDDHPINDTIARLRKASAVLNRRADPFSRTAVSRIAHRALPNVFPSGIIGSLDRVLNSVIQNGTRLYIRGDCVGVGASTLVTTYASVFNMRAREQGDPRKIAVVQINSDCKTVRHLIDLLSSYFQAPLSTSDLRSRSTGVLARRLIAAARLAGVRTIIIDHVSNGSLDVRRAIGDLMLATNPQYKLFWEDGQDNEDWRDWPIGMVLVDTLPPEIAFRHAPEVLLALDEPTMHVSPYTRTEHVAEALVQADIGLDDFDLDRRSDAELASHLLRVSDGLIAILNPLMRSADLVARMAERTRPDIACFEAAETAVPKLIRRLEATDADDPDDPGRIVHSVVARPVGSAKFVDPQAPLQAPASLPPGKPRSRSDMLREKRDMRHIADAESRDMRKRGHRAI